MGAKNALEMLDRKKRISLKNRSYLTDIEYSKRGNMIASSEKIFENGRKEPRMPYCGHIFFAYKQQLYEGRLKNYSQSGLFIEATSNFIENELITVALPFSKYGNDKKKGRIVWKNTAGCGVKLFN